MNRNQFLKGMAAVFGGLAVYAPEARSNVWKNQLNQAGDDEFFGRSYATRSSSRWPASVRCRDDLQGTIVRNQ